MKEIKLYYGYINQSTIDANKHPDEQRKELLELIRNSQENVIEIYSNSPYVMFYITLIHGFSNKNIPEKYQREFKGIRITNKHFEVLKDGSVVEGEYYKGMMSDDCLLNNKLDETNEWFSDLLDLETAIEQNVNEEDIRIRRILNFKL